MSLKSYLQRLQSLQQQFLHIDSSQELADAEREGGLIVGHLLHHRLVDPDALILNSRDLLLDYAAGAIAKPNVCGIPLDNGLAAYYQQVLWTLLVMGASDQQRVVLHKTGCMTWSTDRAKDYKQQGDRYGLLTSELIARIEGSIASVEKSHVSDSAYELARRVLMDLALCGSVSARTVFRKCRTVASKDLDNIAKDLGFIIEIKKQAGRGRPKKIYVKASSN